MSQLGNLFRRPWISKAVYTSAVTLQIACAVHLVNEHVFEVRNSTGASMLPTLAPEGDVLLQLRLPFARLLDSIRSSVTFASSSEGENEHDTHPYYKGGRKNIGGSQFSKADQAQGTGLKVGDLVVALSPFDPSRTVCKRVIGLPGDTVALDPRMRPVPLHAWRGRKAIPPPPVEEGLESKLVRYEDLLASVSASNKPNAARIDGGEVDLLKSMDTDPADGDHPQAKDTEVHNQKASATLTHHTYVRSKGDVQYVTVPLGHVWLAGDNMANSTDSRHYGPVPLGMVRGKVLARVWPNPRWLTNNMTFVD